MKKCRNYRKLITLTSVGAVSALEREMVRQHLTECQACGDYYRQVNNVAENLNTLRDLVGSAGQLGTKSLAERALVSGFPNRSHRVRMRKPAPSWRGGFDWHLLLPALGILVLLILVTHALRAPDQAPRIQSTIAPVMATVEMLPTVANYRAVASQSLDQLDALISQQGNRPVSKPADSAVHDLALLGFGE
jgi:anti-sigma factor RsiW